MLLNKSKNYTEGESMIKIPLIVNSDEKGYFDRQCPNENCLCTFKVDLCNYKERISDKVYCPICRHTDTHSKWWTPQQVKDIEENVKNAAINHAIEELGKSLSQLARSTKNNEFINFTFKLNNTTGLNHPIKQSKKWELEFTCEKCGSKYSTIGFGYFCPFCGYSSDKSVFDESIDIISKNLSALSEKLQWYTDKYGKYKAETICKKEAEGTFRDIVAAFQYFAAQCYSKLSTKKARPNDFQIVEKGDKLFKKQTGKGYLTWISDIEFEKMNLYFQRRHLIEHKGGIVDPQYIEMSNDNSYKIGQRVVAKEADAFELLSIIKKLGDGLHTLCV